MEQGGRGMLLGGSAGVAPATSWFRRRGLGVNAVRMAIGLEAAVTCIDIVIERLYALDLQFGAMVNTIFSTLHAIEDYILQADLVVGAVLVPGAEAPKLITEELVEAMSRAPSSWILHRSGRLFETSHPTTHANPSYTMHGVVHYCVANMLGAVARTSTFALNNATLPFALALANKGPRRNCADPISAPASTSTRATSPTGRWPRRWPAIVDPQVAIGI